MPLTTRTLTDDEQEHLDDHNNVIKPVIDAYETTDPSDFAVAGHTHTAAAVTFAAGGTIAATNVQAAVVEAATDASSALNAHFADTVDAHDATAVSVTATGGITENNVQDALTNVDQRVTSLSAVVTGEPGTIFLDLQAGANADAKLTSALSAAAAATHHPTITLSNAQYSFTTKGRAPFEGLAIRGPGGAAFQEAAGTASGRHSECLLGFESSVDGVGWFHATTTAQARNVSFEAVNLKASGSFKPAFLTQSSDSVVWWMLSLTNIASDSLWGVCGQVGATTAGSQRLVLTGCNFSGPGWDINNGYSTAFYLAGSDSRLFTDGCLLDSPPSRHPATGAGRYHLYCSFLGKTTFGPMFITAEDKWGGCLVEGGNYNATVTDNSGGPLKFYGTIFEGRNDVQASFGSVFRQDGGQTSHFGCEFRQAMEAPATAARSPQDAGAVHIFGGGHMTLYAPSYDRAAGQAETVPFIYASGSDTIVRPHDVEHTTRGGTWTGLPRVQAASSAQVLASDGTYTVI